MATGAPSTDDLNRYRSNYLSELDGAALYRALARAEPDSKRARVFERLAEAELRHAARWAELLRSGGRSVPTHRPGGKVRLLSWLARVFGAERVLPVVIGLEARDEEHYATEPEAVGLPAQSAATGELFAFSRAHPGKPRTSSSASGGIAAAARVVACEPPFSA